MKTVTVTYAESNLGKLLHAAQKERIVLTSAGKPTAVVIGLESYDAEDLQLARSDEFWRMIEERRRGPEIPLAELKARLGQQPRSGRSTRSTKSRRTLSKRKSADSGS